MTVICNPIPGSEVDGIDGEPDHLGDFIEDSSATNGSGFMPQLTGYGWRKWIRTSELKEAVFQKSKAEAIEKYGPVLVNAAERWARPRYPEVSSTYLAGVDPYEFYIRMSRWRLPPSHVGFETEPTTEAGDDTPYFAAGALSHAAGHPAPSGCVIKPIRGCLPAGGAPRLTRREREVLQSAIRPVLSPRSLGARQDSG
jgi:hypothetical protein